MASPSRKSAVKAKQSKLDSVQFGSDTGSVLFEHSAKQISIVVKEYSSNTLNKLQQTEKIVKDLERLGTSIGRVNDETKMLDCAKDICETIADIQKVLDTTRIETMQLGITINNSVKAIKPTESPYIKADERDYTVTYVSDLDITSDSDGYLANHIYSVQSLEDGCMVVTDYWNKTIKLIDNSQNVSTVLKCTGCPWGLCKIKENQFAVTLTDTKRIQILTVNQHNLKVEKEIDIEQPCRGVFNHKSNIYVACSGIGNEGPGHVRIVTIDGQQKIVKEDNNGKQLFARPRQIFVNSATDEVYVTYADDVKILDLHGNAIRRIIDDELKSPYGICEDGQGGVLISGFTSNNILRFDRGGKRLLEVIKKGQLSNPVSLYLHPKTAMLFVGMERNKCVKVFSTE